MTVTSSDRAPRNRWLPRDHYLARLRRMARARGGEVLSPRYVNDNTKLRFRCAEGHEWSQTPGSVHQGRWCYTCGMARAAALRKAASNARLQRVVAKRGGLILSPAYVNSQTKLRYRCADGHEWEAVPSAIAAGRWCPACARQRSRKLHRRWAEAAGRRFAREVRRRGGEILPPGYVTSKVRVRIRCARGHTWETAPDGVLEGVWCRSCREEALLDSLQAVARRWGGECLSRSCRSGRTRLRWRCALGHQWTATGEVVKRGIWCPRCRLPARGSLDQMRRVARERNGECLSEQYVDSETKLRWRCANGHEWEQIPSRVVQGTWCRTCERGWGRSRRRLNVEVMRELAAARGGTCLSTKYRGIYDRLRWRCARGHVWVTPANNIRRGCWCPSCAHSARGTLDGMRALALERGGRCLTRSWYNHREPLHFECGRGHRFHAPANAVKAGLWCGLCPESRRARGGRAGRAARSAAPLTVASPSR